MSLDVVTLALAKTYTDKHSGGSGGASSADGVSYSNEHLADVVNVKAALDDLVASKLTNEENFSGIDSTIQELTKKAHTHTNQDVLNKLDDVDGKLTYDGKDLSSGGTSYTIGDGLKLEGNRLSVDAATSVDKDNTKPITSAAVFTEIGNINALLATI